MIDKTLHLIWLGSEVPPAYMAEVKTLRRLNPDWTIQWWHEADIAGLSLRNQKWFDRAAHLVPEDSVYQLQSDIARLEILHQYGGVYVDLDYRWQQPLGTLVGSEDRLVTCWERQGKNVANGFIAAEAGHPILDQAISEVPKWCLRGQGRRANRITGPSGMWTDLIKRDQRQTRTVRVLPQRLLHAVPWNHPEWAEDFTFPDAAAVHLFGHQRELRGLT